MEAPLVADRPDPIDLLLDQEQDRLDWLLPVRHSRMAVSAFTFYRGAAAVMAASMVLAARDLNLSVKQQEKVCRRTVRAYAKAMAGWTTNRAGYQDYWRQFRDWKLSVDVSVLDAEGLTDYGRLCAWTLAKAHARSGEISTSAVH